jgi:hypothetical protein
MKTQAHDNGETSFTLTPLTTSQISDLYGVTRKTLNKWMKPFCCEIGEKIGRYYTIAQVKVIFDRLGLPNDVVRG